MQTARLASLFVHHSSGQNTKRACIGNDLVRRGSPLAPAQIDMSPMLADAQSTSATGHSRRFLPVHSMTGYPPKTLANADVADRSQKLSHRIASVSRRLREWRRRFDFHFPRDLL